MCTVARAKAIVTGLAVVALLSHLYSFVTAGIVKRSDGSEICDMLEECNEIMRIINIIDSLVTLIIPLILIIVMNTMIGRNLLKFRKRFRQNQETTHREEMSMERSDINLNQINVSNKILINHNDIFVTICDVVKVNKSLHRSGQAMRVPGGLDSHISRQSTHEGDKVSPK